MLYRLVFHPIHEHPPCKHAADDHLTSRCINSINVALYSFLFLFYTYFEKIFEKILKIACIRLFKAQTFYD